MIDEMLLRIFIDHQLMCAQFIENMVQERHFLFGDGTAEPKGILSIGVER